MKFSSGMFNFLTKVEYIGEYLYVMSCLNSELTKYMNRLNAQNLNCNTEMSR